VSDEEMEKLPQRSLGGIGKKTAVRTVVSGLVADLGSRLRRAGDGGGGGGRRGGARPDVEHAWEEARRSRLSEEERAWEDASLQRERERRGAVAGTPQHGAPLPWWRRWWRRVTEGR
jgi:hypothetical protein